MISQPQFGSDAMTQKKQAMPETQHFDGPAGINTPGGENKFAANSSMAIAKPGFES